MTELLIHDIPEFGELIQNRLTKRLADLGCTLKEMAAKCGVPTSTLQRYKNGECTVDCSGALRTLRFAIEDTAEFRRLAKHFFPDQAMMWDTILDKNSFLPNENAPYRQIEENEINYFIYCYAGLAESLPLGLVSKIWGEKGMFILDGLVEANHVRIEGDMVIRDNKNLSYGDLDTIKTIITYLIKEFNSRNVLKKEAGMSNMVKDLNPKGMAEMRAWYEQTCTEMNTILNKKENAGTIPVSASLFFGKMPFADEYSNAVKAHKKKEEEDNPDEN